MAIPIWCKNIDHSPTKAHAHTKNGRVDAANSIFTFPSADRPCWGQDNSSQASRSLPKLSPSFWGRSGTKITQQLLASVQLGPVGRHREYPPGGTGVPLGASPGQLTPTREGPDHHKAQGCTLFQTNQPERNQCTRRFGIDSSLPPRTHRHSHKAIKWFAQ